MTLPRAFFSASTITLTSFCGFVATVRFPEAKRSFLEKGNSSELAGNLVDEVGLLAEHGLFDTPDYSISHERLEAEIDER
jgi:hypothetical protein